MPLKREEKDKILLDGDFRAERIERDFEEIAKKKLEKIRERGACLLYTSPSPRD